MKKVHPAFKHFIIHDALNEWDKILKDTEGKECGVDAGVCFKTSNAFCKILDEDFDIPCKIEMVETLIGNKKAEETFYKYLNKEQPEKFMQEMQKTLEEKGKENLTPDDPVLIGMGHGGKESQFHFIMHLYKHGEVVDLTLEHVKRPQWGINCHNYWAKYNQDAVKNGIFYGEDIAKRSGCVLYTDAKRTRGSIHVDPDKYQRQEDKIRSYIRDNAVKRNIPVFRR